MPYTGRLEERPLLDVIQIVAYSQQSGILTVEGPDGVGLVVFDNGNVICADSKTARHMLAKAAKETDERARLTLRRVQVLVAIRELFDLPVGEYRFEERAEPVAEIHGVSLRPFYASGPLDTGDLLLVLEKAMETMPTDLQPVAPPSREEAAQVEQRRFPRFGPVVIRATLATEERRYEGYVTNVSLGGTFFHADVLPPLDLRGTLDFELPWGLGPCRTQVKVVWLRGDTAEAKRGAGLLFESTGGGSRKRIEAYIKQFQDLAEDVRSGSKGP